VYLYLSASHCDRILHPKWQPIFPSTTAFPQPIQFSDIQIYTAMKSSIKVLFWLYKSKKNTQGLVPLYIRVSLNSQKIEIASGYFILPKSWSEKRKAILESAPQSAEINDARQIQRGKLIAIYNQLLAVGEEFTIDTIKRKFLGKDDDGISLMPQLTSMIATAPLVLLIAWTA